MKNVKLAYVPEWVHRIGPNSMSPYLLTSLHLLSPSLRIAFAPLLRTYAHSFALHLRTSRLTPSCPRPSLLRIVICLISGLLPTLFAPLSSCHFLHSIRFFLHVTFFPPLLPIFPHISFFSRFSIVLPCSFFSAPSLPLFFFFFSFAHLVLSSHFLFSPNNHFA